MQLDISRARRYLKDFDLRTLFIEELGWDQHRQELIVPVNGQEFRLQAVAHKRGLVAFRCAPAADGRIPPYALRRKIETQAAKSVNQHLIIYTDAGQTQQVWQWVKREAGRPTAAREQTFTRDQTGEALIQKLQTIAFSLEEEERLTLVDVAGRVKAGFDVERVTRRFYERFKAEHAGFLKFLRGIPDEAAQRWYASVMINRLMFIYFIQKKGFLDGDPNYLRTRLAASAATTPDRYYADFLRPLFFEGFARREGERSPETNRLLGRVPYLDGGLFQEHPVERACGATIQIADAAFERLFDFFDAYHWHLDERPLRVDNEINPDVLGYIFEKYVNQKQMGAYYTKEDITGYISQNTIIPYLLDAARRDCRVAFEGERSVWALLAADPDRYIYPAMRHGAALPLPAEIAAGVADVSKRDGWNRPAPAEYALPTEIWREVVARRQRYEEVKARLAAGEVRQVNDLITLNLDIRQFAQDVIAECEGPELLRALWKAIESVTILDPTVGSGAFLFAALNVLEPLYEGCLERMEAFVDDLERSGEPHRPEKFSDFRKVLARVAQHPNRRYFILKSIVVNNLYGVDIMEEAVEICKLRLFLKLVAQVERVEDIEPLPDIDFNVRAGNTLVGYVSREDVKRGLTFAGEQGKLMFAEEADALRRFEERAANVERLFGLFRQQQTELGGQVTAEDKAELRRRLDALNDELNRALAREYGVDDAKPKAYKDWLTSHKPFHWFVEFYGIMRRGGFDVVIGNPPYVELSETRKQYSVRDFDLTDTGNLYSLCVERFADTAIHGGRLGVIVPISAVSTPRMLPMMKFLTQATSDLWVSNFAVRPDKLFVGVDMNLSIVLGKYSSQKFPLDSLYSTRYNRWQAGFRPYLFDTLAYCRSELQAESNAIYKLGFAIERNLVGKLNLLGKLARLRDPSLLADRVFYHSGGRYFRKCLRQQLSNEYRELTVRQGWGDAAICLLSSSFYYWFWLITSDCYHVTRGDVDVLPVPDSLIKDSKITSLATRLLDDLWRNSEIRLRNRADASAQKEINFYVGKSKPIIDEIDRVLARHYGFTDEELDFIINYDIKYRMGDELEATDDNG